MSKAVLVMDMPESCEKCMFEQVAQDSELFQDGETYCCVTIKSVSEHSVGRTKPDWCPLWELPEKRPCAGVEGIKSNLLTERVDEGIREAGAFGWNACIDAITGEREEK